MIRRLLCLLFLGVLAGCAAEGAALTARQGQVVRYGLTGLDLPRQVGPGATLTGAWELRSALPIHGLSAMALRDDDLLLATDFGDVLRTTCPVDQRLDRCDDVWSYEGRLVVRGAPKADVEALARLLDGSDLLGMESPPRLARLDRTVQPPIVTTLPGAPDLRFLPSNAGPEATAALPDGSLVIVPEGGVDQDGTAIVLIGKGGDWRQRSMPLPQGFLPTEAAAAGDRLFVLLRSFGLLTGWQSVILSLPIAAIENDMPLAPEAIARIDGDKFGENYEAMAVRRMPDGTFSILVMSDDNDWSMQRTLMLAIRWRGPAGQV